MQTKERDPLLCAAGSFFFPGVGQVYCGRILRGVAFAVPAVLLHVPYAVFALGLHFSWFDHRSFIMTAWSALLPLITRILDFVVRVIATYDAYNVAKPTEEPQT